MTRSLRSLVVLGNECLVPGSRYQVPGTRYSSIRKDT